MGVLSPSPNTHTHTLHVPTPTHTHTHTQALLSPSFPPSLPGWPCLLPPSPPLFLFLSSLPQQTHTNAWPWLHAASPQHPTHPQGRREGKGRENTQQNQAAMQHKHITHHCMR